MQFAGSRLIPLLLALVVLAASGMRAYAQGSNGSLTGQVTDPSGAAIVGASVTLTDLGTNYPQTTVTDSTGVYYFKLVPAGNYSLAINANAFAAYLQNGITINANAHATQNVALHVAHATGETVSVTAGTELIDTTTAELGMTVNDQSMADLPLNGRDPTALALLAPGMVDSIKAGTGWLQPGFSFSQETAASANGGRVGSTYYMLDGVSNMDLYIGMNSPTPNPDAMQEFRLISNNFSAVYGFSSGGVVSMATRSGSNQWHGALFEFLRNQDLNARSWVAGGGGQLDPLKRNQFGGSVGGPVLKNKVFFFFNYQGTRNIGGSGTANNETNTPTQQMLNGDFSGLVDYAVANANNASCGSGYTGPRTPSCGWLNGPFQVVDGKPNQLIGGAAALNPAAVQMTNDALPGHTAPATGTSTPSATSQNLAGQMFYSTAQVKYNSDEYMGKVDYDISTSQRLTVRSYIDRYMQPSGDIPGNVLSVLNLSNWATTSSEMGWYFNEILQHTWTVSPTTVNTATVLWNQQSFHSGAAVVDHEGKNVCWSRYIKVTEPACFMEGANFGGASGAWTEPSNEVRGTIGFSDTLIKTVHRHTLSVGIDLMHERAVENAIDYPADAIVTFNGAYTGSGPADWLLGYMNTFEQGAGELADIQGWLVDPYINDEFRIKSGLSVTLGLRWEPDFAPVSVGGRGAAFVPNQQSAVFPLAPQGLVYPGDRGVNDALRSSDKAYLEPRFGVAYQPSRLPHTSFHAAFGMFTAAVPYSNYNHMVDIAPFSPAFSPAAPSTVPLCWTGGVQAACTPNTGQTITGYENLNDPWSTSTFGTNGVDPFPPFASVGYKPPSNSPIPGPVFLQTSFSRNFKSAMTQAWNASVEQQLTNVMAIRLAYVGSESYHQSYVQDDNYAGYSFCTSYTSPNCPAPALAPPPVTPYSNFSGILEYDSGATASYHSLQATFQRNMAHGLQAQSSFTWQKTIDIANFANAAFNSYGINNPRNLEWSRGVSSSSFPFTWTTNFVYRTPELRTQGILVREVLGGWELSPIATWQSGAPFSIQPGSSQSAYGEPGRGSGCLQYCGGDRADRVPGVPLKVRQGGRSNWVKHYFNPDAFATRHDGTFGNSAKNLIYGPPGFSVDSALMKNWAILEKYQLQFRFELFNAFNHPIMGQPDLNPNDSSFGQINNGQGSVANTARVGQAAMKFFF